MSKLTQKKVVKMTVEEYIGPAGISKIRDRVEDFIHAKEGFILIYTGGDNKITDAYKGICSYCVLKRVKSTVKDANKAGLLWKKDVSCLPS